MAREAIERATRRRVRLRAGRRCEYCLHPDEFSCAPFACEHVIPRSQGTGSRLDDLAWSRAGCNSHKAAKLRHQDPAAGRLVRLFNPRRQRWSRHFLWSEDSLLILARTAVARATVEALHLNRVELINLRQALASIGRHPPDEVPMTQPAKPR